MFWLNWTDAADQPIAGTTGLPGYGSIRFWPDGVAAMKTAETWAGGQDDQASRTWPARWTTGPSQLQGKLIQRSVRFQT